MRKYLFLILTLAFATAATGQTADSDAANIAGNLQFRNLSPGMTGGRISKVVKNPDDPSTWYVAVSSAGVWKTENAGTTWEPVFDREGSYSIGTVTLDPSDPNVVWVGTGENNSQRSVGYGDGVYKSVDAGQSWTNMGLESSNHIGNIVIDPRNSDVVYVASQGPLWSSGGERGLYKTTDGGENWRRVLYVSEDTGISDVAMDPAQPDILYAASYQRRRHFGILIAGGPEGAIYKSVDGGENWKKLTRGLPTGPDVGRIGLAISPQKPQVVYAIIAAEEGRGGFYRSADRGESWTRKSDHMVVDAQYYMELFPSPHEFDKVYAVDVRTHYTEDGGATWTRMRESNKHVDNHDIVFNPEDPGYLMMSSDGGIYESWDRGETWRFIDNLPITQFYRVGIDNSKPFYFVYGGTQDNSTLGVPNQTVNRQGIVNGDWFYTKGGDGFQTRVDPENPDIVYSMSQYGDIARFDRQSGQLTDIQPRPAAGEPPLRWHWNAPLILSPHNNKRLYFAANKLFRSNDMGNSWTPVSGDLTRQLDRNSMRVMGRVWSPEAVFKNVYTSPLSTVVALDESPLVEGLLYAGTDDGLIQVSEDGGARWRKTESFPGVPEYAYVSDLFASRINGDQVVAVFNNHKYGDYKPYVLVSNNRGRSWQTLNGDLPRDEFGWSVYQDHEDEDLLFLGTEFGLSISLDGGTTWTGVRDLPTIPIRDIEIHREEDDLVLASFGRGFYIADDYAYLRNLDEDVLAEEAHIFPVKEARQYIEASPHSGSQGHNFFSSPNPDYGALITYHLRDDIPTLKELRKDKEDQQLEDNEPIEYPDWERLEREDRQEAPFVAVTISDGSGEVVARIRRPARNGIHRVTWDLRASVAGQEGRRSARPLVPPGEYEICLATVVDGEWNSIGNCQPALVTELDNVTLPAKDRRALASFQHDALRLDGRIDAADETLENALAKLGRLKEAIFKHADRPSRLRASEAETLRIELLDLQERLNGDLTKTSRSEYDTPSIRDRAGIASGSVRGSTSPTTATQKENYRIASEQFELFLKDLRSLTAKMDRFEKRLADDGIIIK